MDGLHVALERDQMSNVYRGISINGIKISHRLYVDFVVLLLPWSLENPIHVVRIIHFFHGFGS